MDNYEMKSNRDVEIIDEEISKIDTKDSIKTRLFIELNTAHCLKAITEELIELNSILRRKSGIEQPDGWDSSKNQKDTEDSNEESGNMVVPDTVISDLDGLRNDVDDLSQQVDTLRDDMDYKSNEDHDHDHYLTSIDIEDLEDKVNDKIRNLKEKASVNITWRDDE